MAATVARRAATPPPDVRPAVPPGTELRAIQYTLQSVKSPIRQRILALLYAARAPMTFTEVARRLNVADDSSISFHLNRLTGPGLVANYLQRTPGGIRSIYVISDEGVRWMRRLTLTRPDVLDALLHPERTQRAARNFLREAGAETSRKGAPVAAARAR